MDSLDFIRGVCALAVASYHVLAWLKVAELHALGTYGVYAFFVISGASLAMGYAHRIEGTVALQRFLLARYARLLPLFGTVLLYFVIRHGLPGRALAEAAGLVLLNVSFLFGLANPGATSIVTGGWSLGIEFVFYLLFPLLMAALTTSRVRVVVLIVSFVAQRAFLELTLHDASALRVVWVQYTQPLTFVAYFAFGCVLGLLRLEHSGPISTTRSVWWGSGSLLLLAFVFGLPNAGEVDCLTGAKGAMLSCATIASVACASRVTLRGGVAQRVARYFGDISYGVYLLHPILYDDLKLVLGKRGLMAHPFVVLVVVLLLATLGALLVKRWIEAPALRMARARIARIGR